MLVAPHQVFVGAHQRCVFLLGGDGDAFGWPGGDHGFQRIDVVAAVVRIVGAGRILDEQQAGQQACQAEKSFHVTKLANLAG